MVTVLLSRTYFFLQSQLYSVDPLEAQAICNSLLIRVDTIDRSQTDGTIPACQSLTNLSKWLIRFPLLTLQIFKGSPDGVS